MTATGPVSASARGAVRCGPREGHNPHDSEDRATTVRAVRGLGPGRGDRPAAVPGILEVRAATGRARARAQAVAADASAAVDLVFI